MAAETGKLTDIEPACAWPRCGRAPQVRVEYERDRAHDLRLAWLPPAHGIVCLCEQHADVLEDALGPGRIVGLARLA